MKTLLGMNMNPEGRHSLTAFGIQFILSFFSHVKNM